MKREKTSRPFRVLTVDEQPIVHAGLKATLERANVAVCVGEAYTDSDAVKQVRRLKPDVVLFGLRKSKEAEVESIQSLRKRVPNAKVLVLGGDEDDDARYILRLLRAGAHGYLSRSSSPRELLRATEAVFDDEVYLSATVTPRALKVDHSRGVQAQKESRDSKLSPRETQVLVLIARGLTNRDIATTLRISARTVGTHRERIMTKLQLHSVAALTRYAVEHDLK